MATIAKDPSPSLHTALKSLLMLRFFWRFPRRHGAWPKYEYLKPWIAGLEPKAVVDVGVNKGQFLHLAHRLFPDAAIIGTELVVELCAKARRIYRDDSGLTLHDCAYGDEDGKSEFFITRDSQNCSTHRPTEDFYAARPGNALIETSRVTVNRLDRILEAVPGPLFVKIDAQGGELEVLEGLGKRLADVAALIIESPFEKAYGGGCLVRRHLRFLDPEWAGLCRRHGPTRFACDRSRASGGFGLSQARAKMTERDALQCRAP